MTKLNVINISVLYEWSQNIKYTLHINIFKFWLFLSFGWKDVHRSLLVKTAKVSCILTLVLITHILCTKCIAFSFQRYCLFWITVEKTCILHTLIFACCIVRKLGFLSNKQIRDQTMDFCILGQRDSRERLPRVSWARKRPYLTIYIQLINFFANIICKYHAWLHLSSNQ